MLNTALRKTDYGPSGDSLNPGNAAGCSVAPQDVSTKLCRHCGQVKERADFYPHNRDGLRTMCRLCQRTYSRAEVAVLARHRDEVAAEFARLSGAEAVAS